MIPQRTFEARSVSFDIGAALDTTKRDRDLPYQSWSGEYLFSFKLPYFQRGFVWTERQCVRFIESAWLGFSLGSYMVNELDWVGRFIPEADGFLIDGQQRLTAIQKYVNDEFRVFDQLWSELTVVEKRRFKGTQFNQMRVYIKDMAKLEDLYERLNFGGTPHSR